MARKGTVVKNVQSDINPFSLVQEFTYFKEAQNVSSMTIISFKHTLNHFFAEYKGNIQDTKKLQMAVSMFLVSKSNEYYNKQLQALRQFFGYCIGEGVIRVNPCDGLKYRRHSVRIIEHSQETIKALLSMPDKSLFVGLRDYVAMLVMLDCGIRPNELLQITLNDIDFANSQMIVREIVSKTNTLRTLPLSPNVITQIKKLIYARHENWGSEVPVFCTIAGYRLSSHDFQKRFKIYSEKLGVTVTPYHLRHTFALWFVRNGGNLFALQKIMGHTKLDMTRTYVNLVQADLKNSHKKATPINNLFDQAYTVRKIKGKK